MARCGMEATINEADDGGGEKERPAGGLRSIAQISHLSHLDLRLVEYNLYSGDICMINVARWAAFER